MVIDQVNHVVKTSNFVMSLLKGRDSAKSIKYTFWQYNLCVIIIMYSLQCFLILTLHVHLIIIIISDHNFLARINNAWLKSLSSTSAGSDGSGI